MSEPIHPTVAQFCDRLVDSAAEGREERATERAERMPSPLTSLARFDERNRATRQHLAEEIDASGSLDVAFNTPAHIARDEARSIRDQPSRYERPDDLPEPYEYQD